MLKSAFYACFFDIIIDTFSQEGRQLFFVAVSHQIMRGVTVFFELAHFYFCQFNRELFN